MKPVYAIAVFNHGYVKFTEDLKNNRIKIDSNIKGLSTNSLHGFHVREAGDLTDHCNTMCSHFNPYNNRSDRIEYKTMV
jgi:Cu-Zn family superoxide dismutase